MRADYLVALIAWCAIVTQPVRAVLFYSTGDTNFNTSAPTGAYSDSGWQWEGLVGAYLGTAIAPNYFITAKHLAVNTNWTFTYQGQAYTIAAVSNSPTSDLTVCRVNGTFSNYAQLYMDGDEVGKEVVVFGRGTDRGAAVTNVSLQLGGWQWGAHNYTERWGVNVLTDAGTAGSNPYLAADFNADGGANECMLSVGDSGGGAFIQDGGVWKLAGIHWAVDPALFNTIASDAGSYNAAMFDVGGMYYKEDTWYYLPDQAQDVPASFYDTRISAQADWIVSVIPEPSGVMFVGVATLFVLRMFRRWRA